MESGTTSAELISPSQMTFSDLDQIGIVPLCILRVSQSV